MKKKYLTIKNDEKNELIIREFAESDKKGEYTLLCEEIYNRETIASAISKGKKALISTLRTQNMYPPIFYAEKIAESAIKLYSSQNDQSVEIFFDDKDFISKDLKRTKTKDNKEDEPVEFNELLEGKPDNLDISLDDNNIIKNIAFPINSEKTEPPDIEDDN